MKILAFDVSKDVLDGCDGTDRPKLANKPESIRKMLKCYDASSWAVLLEPTSIYHMELAVQAHRAGFTVFLVNPRVISKFREGRSRIKTDQVDAECLHAFGSRNWQDLRPWEPLKQEAERLRSCIKRYHKVVSTRAAMVQSLAGCELQEFEAALSGLNALAKRLEEEAIAAAKALDGDLYERLLAATGFGQYSASSFTYLLRSRHFKDAEQLKAFIGLDMSFKDSGTRKGKRSISKCGDSTFRHAATCAGRGLLNSKLGTPMRLDLQARGRHSAERLVIAAKKQVRIAFALASSDEPYDPNKFRWRVDTKT
jgi:transposase